MSNNIKENFKPIEKSIDLSNEKLDNAQYIMLVLIEKYNIKSISDSSDIDNSIIANILKNKNGISIGEISSIYGNFEFLISGIPKIYNEAGEQIIKPSVFKKYLLGELDINKLHFENKAYIQLINHTQPNLYYGVFYSISDAIKICSENDLVKTGEVIS